MTESMVERVAKAMAWADLTPESREKATRDGLTADCIVLDEDMLRLARAAIKAMRDTTHEMDLAGIKTGFIARAIKEGPAHWQIEYPKMIFTAMIDAALAGIHDEEKRTGE